MFLIVNHPFATFLFLWNVRTILSAVESPPLPVIWTRQQPFLRSMDDRFGWTLPRCGPINGDSLPQFSVGLGPANSGRSYMRFGGHSNGWFTPKSANAFHCPLGKAPLAPLRQTCMRNRLFACAHSHRICNQLTLCGQSTLRRHLSFHQSAGCMTCVSRDR
jgi:hypothetical protein